MLVRVFEIPPPTGNYHFAGGEPQMFIEVDWFRNDEPLVINYGTEEGREIVEKFIRSKHYFNQRKAYLVLHPEYAFTIGYRAP